MERSNYKRLKSQASESAAILDVPESVKGSNYKRLKYKEDIRNNTRQRHTRQSS